MAGEERLAAVPASGDVGIRRLHDTMRKGCCS